jgi:hypothetical protein
MERRAKAPGNRKCNLIVAYVQLQRLPQPKYFIVIISLMSAASYMLHIFWFSTGAEKLTKDMPHCLDNDLVPL